MNRPPRYLLLILLFIPQIIFSQKIDGKIQFQSGQTWLIQTDLKATVTQQAMGNAISFLAGGDALYGYRVGTIQDGQTTLRHETRKINFNFDGMGQKRSFSSDNQADLAGPFGEPVKQLLAKRFDLVIDQNGTVVATIPAKIEPVKTDERLAIVLNIVKDIYNVVYPPAKGEASFFQVLPEREISLGESWSDSTENESGKTVNTYTLTELTDSTIIVDFKSNALTIAKAMMMGRETKTTLNSVAAGRILLDRRTGIIREKSSVTDSNGVMEAMGNSTPVTSRTEITIRVYPGS